MGTFDYITYQGHKYQTKDTPSQWLDNYKIEVDQCSGHLFLWHEAYTAKFVKDHTAPLGSRMETSNHRWECCHEFDGVIDFYRSEDNDKTWIEYHSLFMDGKLIKIKNVSDDYMTDVKTEMEKADILPNPYVAK